MVSRWERLGRSLVSCALTAAAIAAAPAHAGTLIVSNRGDETIQLIDTATRQTIRTIAAGVGAHEFAVSPDGRTVVGSCYGSGPQHQIPDQRLVVLDLREPDAARLIDLGDNPRPNDLRFLPDGRSVAVTSEVRQRVLVVDVAAGQVTHEADLDHPAGHMLALSPDGRRAYVPSVLSGQVLVVDLAPGAEDAVVGSVMTAFGAEGVDLSPDGRWLWVASNKAQSVAVVDTTELEVVQTIPTQGYPFRVRFTPDGEQVLVALPALHAVRVFDAQTREHRGDVDLPNGQPTSIAVSADSERAYVVCGAIGKVAEIDLATLEVAHWFQTGPIPDAIAGTPARPAAG
jgi:YVTN family beta-propeller protein